MLAYVTILATAISGFAGAPIWVVLIGAVALATLSYAEHYMLYQRSSELGLTDLIDTTLLGSLFNGFAACAMGYGMGVVLKVVGI
jgi:hypothetical protein